MLAEAIVNGTETTITRYYIYGNGLLAMVTPAGDVYCYHFNGVGSTVAITNSSQTVVNKYSYDPFGNIASQSETVISSQPFKYVGQYGVMTEPNGYYYMRARYYDPKVGRFISEDPIGFAGGDTNLMAYVGNNPVNFVDPWGLCASFYDLIGVTLGEESAQWYADKYNETGDEAYLIAGLLASLWTRDTYMQTLFTLLWALGPEIKIGSNLRIAPFGNRTNSLTGELPHYHRRIIGSDGQVAV